MLQKNFTKILTKCLSSLISRIKPIPYKNDQNQIVFYANCGKVVQRMIRTGTIAGSFT